jgi:DNA-binding NtrC family response regulator
MRILIIDDEPSVLDILLRLLTHDGHDCISSTNAKDGLSIFRTANIDIVLTDIYMPDKNGFMLLDELRSNYPDCIVVVFTGYGDVDAANTAMQKGAFAFFTKPIDFESLRKTLSLIERQIQLAHHRTETAILSS